MEVAAEWKLANARPTYKKGWKENPGNYRLVNPMSVLGKVMNQIILIGTDHKAHAGQPGVLGQTANGLIKAKSCLTKNSSFQSVTSDIY